MKIIKKTLWILAFLLVSTTTLVAQSNGSEPTDFGTIGDTANNPTDAQEVPINTYLFFLAVSGICFVFYKQYKIINPKL